MARVRVEVPVEPKQQSAPETHQQITVPRINGKKLLFLVGALVVVGLIFVLINDRNHLKNELKKESSQTQSDTQKYQNEVAELVEVPDGTTPKVQTLTDTAVQQLASKDAAFKSAQAGDVVLVYDKKDNTRFVVIYRPSSKKVILATAASVTAASTNQP